MQQRASAMDEVAARRRSHAARGAANARPAIKGELGAGDDHCWSGALKLPEILKLKPDGLNYPLN